MEIEKRYFQAQCERAASGEWTPGDPIRFVASTENVARDGWIVVQEGAQLENYRKNPVFLWMHNYYQLPIGRVSPIAVENKQLVIDVAFDQSDEFAKSVERKYREGYLSAVSIGWSVEEYERPKNEMDNVRITKWELLDISAVTVPGDPDALMMRMYQGLKEVVDPSTGSGTEGDEPHAPSALRQAQGTEGVEEDEWASVAAEMVALFDPASDESDEVRERRYKALQPSYRRAGKVSPEFLAMEDLRALGSEEIAGLFMEGEGPLPTSPIGEEIADESEMLEMMARLLQIQAQAITLGK